MELDTVVCADALDWLKDGLVGRAARAPPARQEA
jgi:hypothetical protein